MGYRYPERESAGGWILHLDSARTREGERVRRSPKPPFGSFGGGPLFLTIQFLL